MEARHNRNYLDAATQPRAQPGQFGRDFRYGDALSCPDTSGNRGHAMSKLTELLGKQQAGDEAARGELFEVAYAELRRLARFRLRAGGRNAVMDSTCLVHEAYLRFVSAGELRAQDRRAFFSYASHVMRSIIVNSARDQIAQKRGGDWRPLTLSTQLAADVPGDHDVIVNVHEALEKLERADPRLARVAEMRYFGGYSEQEIADALNIAERTVRRDWDKARLILAQLMGEPDP